MDDALCTHRARAHPRILRVLFYYFEDNDIRVYSYAYIGVGALPFATSGSRSGFGSHRAVERLLGKMGESDSCP